MLTNDDVSSTPIRCSRPTAAVSPTSRRSRTVTSTSTSEPIKDGQWAGDEIAVSQDNRYRNSRLYFGAEDLHITPAWTRDGKQLLLVSNRGVPLGSGEHLAARRRSPAEWTMRESVVVGADALSCAPGRLDRWQTIRLLVDAGSGRSVLEPLRAAGRRRGTLQADVLRARCFPSALVARRRVDCVYRQPRGPAAARAARSVRRRRIESSASSIAGGSGRWACFRFGRVDEQRADDRRANPSHRVPTASSTRLPMRTRASAQLVTGFSIPPAKFTCRASGRKDEADGRQRLRDVARRMSSSTSPRTT